MKTTQKLRCAAMFVLLSVAMTQTQAQNNGVAFPDLNKTYLKTGDFVNIENLGKIAIGETYHQVRLLIGNPHFSEGIGSPNAYNYAFNFFTNQAKGEYITCQYQVQFSKEHKVTGMFWRDNQCANYLVKKEAPPPPPAPPIQRTITLAADGMFAFGKSGFNDLLPAGQQKLTQAAAQIVNEFNLSALQVIGHTDRIGSDASNAALSLARAEAVKQFLASRGVPAGLISTRGMASAQPVVNCTGAKSPAVIACLLPNRRVELIFSGTAKSM